MKEKDTVRYEDAVHRVLSVVDDNYLVIDHLGGPKLVHRSDVQQFSGLSDHEVQVAVSTVVPEFLRSVILEEFRDGNESVRSAVETAYRGLFPPKLVDEIRRLQKDYGPEGVALCAMQLARMPGILEAFHFDAENPTET